MRSPPLPAAIPLTPSRDATWQVRTLSAPAALMEGYIYFPLCCASRGMHVATGSNGFDGSGCEVLPRTLLTLLTLLPLLAP